VQRYIVFDCKRTEEIMRELKIPQVKQFIQEYRINGKEQLIG
jgi:hypothetical protein